MSFEKTYTVKQFDQSPFYVSIPNKKVYVLCDDHGQPYAQLHNKPWFLKEGAAVKEGEIESEMYNVKSKLLEPGDTVTFMPFSEGIIEKIIPIINDSWDWGDKFVLVNCKSVQRGVTIESKQTLLRSDCTHKHYRMCIINFSESDKWQMFERAWNDFAKGNLTPSTEDIMIFLKDKVEIKF